MRWLLVVLLACDDPPAPTPTKKPPGRTIVAPMIDGQHCVMTAGSPQSLRCTPVVPRHSFK